MVMKRYLLFSAALFLMLIASLPASAELGVKQPCSDGMVLQQLSSATVWGHASAGAAVTVVPSWNGKKYSCTADESGVWRLCLPTPAGSYQKHSIRISGDGGRITIADVLVGEVWLASGQSNMEMPVRGFHNCPVEDSQEAMLAKGLEDKVRMYTEPKRQSYSPEYEGRGSWHVADRAGIMDMSATAFFFAQELNRILDVPVGIVNNAYGGARVEGWLPYETLKAYGTEDLGKEAVEAFAEDYRRPYVIYNAMQYPLKGYTVKGIIWYQGCSNVGMHEEFVPRMKELIAQFRRDFAPSDGSRLPFYMCEIAPYDYGDGGGAIGAATSYGALLRQAQHQVAAQVEDCDIVVTNDLVYSHEIGNIHPSRKKAVGQRLARMALNRNYGMDGYYGIWCDYPLATSLEVDAENPNRLYVTVENCPEGIGRMAGIEGLEASPGNGEWYSVSDCTYDVGSKTMTLNVAAPYAPAPGQESSAIRWELRYGWGDFRPGNLKNNQGYPFAPFWITE